MDMFNNNMLSCSCAIECMYYVYMFAISLSPVDTPPLVDGLEA